MAGRSAERLRAVDPMTSLNVRSWCKGAVFSGGSVSVRVSSRRKRPFEGRFLGAAERGLCKPSSARMERVRANKPPKRGLLFFGLRECIAEGAGGAEEEGGGSIGGLGVEVESSAGFKLAERGGGDW